MVYTFESIKMSALIRFSGNMVVIYELKDNIVLYFKTPNRPRLLTSTLPKSIKHRYKLKYKNVKSNLT